MTVEFTFDLLARTRKPPLTRRLIEAFSFVALVLAALLFVTRCVGTASGVYALHREARRTAPELPDRAEIEKFSRAAAEASERMNRLDLSFSRLLDALEQTLPQGTAIRRVELSLDRSGTAGRTDPRGAIVAHAANFETAAQSADTLAAHPLFRDVALRTVGRDEGKILFRLEFRHVPE